MGKKIFVSSTCFDLIDFRAELKVFLESAGLLPIMSDQNNSEFRTLPDQNSIETCLVNLRSCDTVIFALSKRYGGNLKKAGFGDFSATHLEYLEAKRLNKRILFFVRDRLLADYNHFKKSGNANGLLWIDKSDMKLFEVIEDRKLLTTGPNDNWVIPFRDTIDVKQRLAIDLKHEIKGLRMDKLIESGNMPFLTVWASAEEIANSSDINLEFEVTNVGNQVAIGPVLALFKVATYQEVLDGNLYTKPGNYATNNFKSLLPNSSEKTKKLRMKVNKEKSIDEVKLVTSILYKTIYGDLLTDVTEITVKLDQRPKLDVRVRYTTKHYLAEESYAKLVAK